MGRVNRYKKVKACDPGSKNFGKAKADTKHDDPPEMFEQRSKKLNRDRDDRWDDESKRERMYQREAIRELRQNQAKENVKEKKIESKRDDESMQQFKSRIRQETKKTLAEEIQKMTSTAQKRKLRLKERSLKRKNKKGGKGAEDKEVIEFFSAENGHIRPSDLGESRSSFAPAEAHTFGERAERPPDLNAFTAKFRTTKSVQEAQSHANHNGGAEDSADSEGVAESEEESEEEEEVQLTKNQRNKKRKAQASIFDRADLDGDDGLESIRTSSESLLKKPNVGNKDKSHISGAQSGGKNGNSASKKDIKPVKAVSKVGTKEYNEMEALRTKVQDAYKLLKEKRRLENEALYKGTR